MATSFPSSLDSFTNPTAVDTLDSPPHDTQHADANDAIEALQAKVGVDGSAVTTSLDYKVAQLESDVAGLVTGKILQVVRATDSTARSTTSTSPQDTGLSVTITPQKSDSAIILIATAMVEIRRSSGQPLNGGYWITDNSNNDISGAEAVDTFLSGFSITGGTQQFQSPTVLVGYSTPATTSATTYKTRYQVYAAGQTILLNNSSRTAQLYAIEVSA